MSDHSEFRKNSEIFEKMRKIRKEKEERNDERGEILKAVFEALAETTRILEKRNIRAEKKIQEISEKWSDILCDVNKRILQTDEDEEPEKIKAASKEAIQLYGFLTDLQFITAELRADDEDSDRK